MGDRASSDDGQNVEAVVLLGRSRQTLGQGNELVEHGIEKHGNPQKEPASPHSGGSSLFPEGF